MDSMAKALAELEEWATEPLPSKPVKQTHDQQRLGSTFNETNTGDASCLAQHELRDLFRLATSVKGCPMPETMMPNLPR